MRDHNADARFIAESTIEPEAIAKARAHALELGAEPVDPALGAQIALLAAASAALRARCPDLLGGGEYLGRRRGHIDLAVAALDLGQFAQSFVRQLKGFFRLSAGRTNEIRSKTFLIVQKGFQHMFGGKLLVPVSQRYGLGGLNETAGAVRIIFKLHLDLGLSVKRL